MTQEMGLETHVRGQHEASPDELVGLSAPTRWLECPLPRHSHGCRGQGGGGPAWEGSWPLPCSWADSWWRALESRAL